MISHGRREIYMEQAVEMGAQHPHLLLCLVSAGSDSFQVGASLSHSAHVYKVLRAVYRRQGPTHRAPVGGYGHDLKTHAHSSHCQRRRSLHGAQRLRREGNTQSAPPCA